MPRATEPPTAGAPPPVPSGPETVAEMVRLSGRDAVPLRTEFLQITHSDGTRTPGPLASFVTAGDLRALMLYLLLVTKASAGDFEAALAAPVWARALDLWNPTGKTATSTISKIWLRIERRHLIERRRRNRLAEVRLLREDGSGDPYTHPGQARDRHLKLPHAFWTTGPTEALRWYQHLSLPEITMLLIARSLGDGFRLPFESAPEWYGISADTASRGLHGLVDDGLLDVHKHFKSAPLAPQGYTAELHYTLMPPFGPKGVRSAASRRATAS